MLDVISNEMMRMADRYTIDTLGISGEELMLRASQGILEEVRDYDRIAIIVGKGNNGGDGICLAKLLIEEGKKPDVYMFSRECKGESLYYYNYIKDYDNIYDIKGDEDFSSYDVIVDAIFGTGLDRDVTGVYSDTIDNINDSHTYVVSVDIPSGLNGNNGDINNNVIIANKTISINTRKAGLYLQNGKDYTGEIVNKDIGISLVDEPYHLVVDEDVVFPRRRNNSHKGTYGTVAIIGGCRNYMGATKLAYMGVNSLMSGAGLVRICVPYDYVNTLAREMVETTIYPMHSKDGHMVYNEEDLLLLLNMDVIAIGMGIGDSEYNIDILRYLMKNYDGKLLIDADGINALSKDVAMLDNARCDIVLTPHVKEMSRLTGLDTRDILADPIGVATSFATKYNVTVLLKGTSTVVTDGKDVFIIDRGVPSMAKAGSGDVLSGITAGMLANKGLSTIKATYYASYIAGVAGEMARDEYGDYGALARDTARYTSYAMKKYTN